MKKNIIALVIGIISVSLAWYWYDWRLVVVIFLSLFANNLDRSNQGKL